MSRLIWSLMAASSPTWASVHRWAATPATAPSIPPKMAKKSLTSALP